MDCTDDTCLLLLMFCAEASWGQAVPASSSLPKRTKSFLSTRMRMVARKPVSSSTVTQLLMIENQWICARQAARRAHVRREHRR